VKPHESNAGPKIGEHENFRTDSVTEMQALESLPKRLQRAIVWSALSFSAAQAKELIDAGTYTDDQLAAAIEADTNNRQKGPIICRPRKGPRART